MNPHLRKAINALITDVEAMRCEMPAAMDKIGEEDESKHWFGDFENAHLDTETYSGTAIQWPNLSILIDQLKAELPKE